MVFVALGNPRPAPILVTPTRRCCAELCLPPSKSLSHIQFLFPQERRLPFLPRLQPPHVQMMTFSLGVGQIN